MKYLVLALTLALFSCTKEEQYGGDIAGSWQLRYVVKDGIPTTSGGNVVFKNDGTLVMGVQSGNYKTANGYLYIGGSSCPISYKSYDNKLIIYYKVDDGFPTSTCILEYNNYVSYLSR